MEDYKMKTTKCELKISRATRFWANVSFKLNMKVIVRLSTGKELEFKKEKKSKILTLSYSGTLRRWEKEESIEAMELMGL